MFLRRWFGKFRVEGEREHLKRRGEWGDNFQTLEVLLAHLRTCTFTYNTLLVRDAVRCTVRTDNIDQLVQIVRRAFFIMSQEADVERDPFMAKDPLAKTLDQYLISHQDIPIRPEDVVTVLGEAIDQFTQHLALLVSTEDSRSGYYQRQYSTLMAEVREVLDALLHASDLYNPSKPV